MISIELWIQFHISVLVVHFLSGIVIGYLGVLTGFIENHRLDHKKDDKFVVQFAKLRVQIDIKAIQLIFPVFIT